MYTLSIMTEMSHGSYLVHAESFAMLFTNILNNLTQLDSNLAYYTVVTMKNLVPIISGHQQVSNSICNLCMTHILSFLIPIEVPLSRIMLINVVKYLTC